MHMQGKHKLHFLKPKILNLMQEACNVASNCVHKIFVPISFVFKLTKFNLWKGVFFVAINHLGLVFQFRQRS